MTPSLNASSRPCSWVGFSPADAPSKPLPCRRARGNSAHEDPARRPHPGAPPYLFARHRRAQERGAQAGAGTSSTSASAIPTCRRRRTSSRRCRRRPPSRATTATRRTTGMEAFREAAVDWYREPLRRDARRQQRSAARSSARRRASRTSRSRFVESGRRGARARPGLSGLRDVDALRRRRAVHSMPLRRENGFLPDLDAIPADVAKRAKIMWINYPNNPTAALAAARLLRAGRRVRAEARHHRRQRRRLLARCTSTASRRCRSSRRRARKEVGIEFQSLSKTYNMTGWRVGFARRQRGRWSAGSAR